MFDKMSLLYNGKLHKTHFFAKTVAARYIFLQKVKKQFVRNVYKIARSKDPGGNQRFQIRTKILKPLVAAKLFDSIDKYSLFLASC